MPELLSYTVDGKEYQVEITRKWMRTIQYRFRDGIFKISAPRLVSKTTILAGLEKFARGLIKRSEKVPAITDEYIYMSGRNIIIESASSHKQDIIPLKHKCYVTSLTYIKTSLVLFLSALGINSLSSKRVLVSTLF